jgi:hypothetical protein
VLKRRCDWFEGQPDLDPSKLIFVDEPGASTNLARKGGRCRRGRRLRAAVPHGHVWTPPWMQEELWTERRVIGWGHVSGLLCGKIAPLARMGFEGQVHIITARSKRLPCAWFS